jgi:aspartyl-tRNA(Asn)/glutamyl-tRNA(Gln) amidotransferase subunit B
MSEYKATIGLEVHAELGTKTGMFCDCVNDPDENRPNVNVCPVCLGHPGALPTINKEAVERVIKVGLAINGHINEVTKFDRKNYFYPDLPKGYQISQFDMPLVVGGELAGVKITRIHLEEDAGKLMHAPDGKSTLVDFNRAGVPLMELVTEPVIRDAEEAIMFARELQSVLRYLGVSDADLERGQMRADANISVSNTDKLGTRVEVKNLNSWSFIEAAINHEIKRQTEVLEKGGTIDQETRGWDSVKMVTKIQRSKEHAHDYRYFPDPDLPPFETTLFDVKGLRSRMPELPAAKRERFAREFGLTEKQARTLVEEKAWADFFEAAVSELALQEEGTESKLEKRPLDLLFNYFTSDFLGLLREMGIKLTAAESTTSAGEVKVTPAQLAALVDLIVDGKIMSRQAKDILRKMVETGANPEEILTTEGLHTVSDAGELEVVVRAIIAENPKAVADYKAGKEASVQFMIGKAMGALKGRGNPGILKEIFVKELK